MDEEKIKDICRLVEERKDQKNGCVIWMRHGTLSACFYLRSAKRLGITDKKQ